MVHIYSLPKKPKEAVILDAGGVLLSYSWQSSQVKYVDQIVSGIKENRLTVSRAPGTDVIVDSSARIVIYTSNYQEIVQAALRQVGLEDRVHRVINTKEKGVRFDKDSRSYIDIFREAKRDGYAVSTVADDTVAYALQALYASIQEKISDSSSHVRVYLVRRGASEGRSKYGFYVVNDLGRIGKVEHRKSDYEIRDEEELSGKEKEALEKEWEKRVGASEKENPDQSQEDADLEERVAA